MEWRRARVLTCIVGLFLILQLNGCQTSVPLRVDGNELEKPQAPAGLQIMLLARARDIRDKPRNQVGRHLFFLLPGPQVVPEEDLLDRAIPKAVQTALQASGYTVTMVGKLREAKGPVAVVQIDDLRNYLFTLPYPLGWGWGRMQLSLHLLTPDGKEIWVGKTERDGGMMASLFYMSGFQRRVQKDLKTNLNQIITMVSSDEFKKHLAAYGQEPS